MFSVRCELGRGFFAGVVAAQDPSENLPSTHSGEQADGAASGRLATVK